MRTVVPLLLLLSAGAVGCQHGHPHRFWHHDPCPPDAEACGPAGPAVVQAAPPDVEIRPAGEIRVKAPPQIIKVTLPPAEAAAPPQPPMAAYAAAGYATAGYAQPAPGYAPAGYVPAGYAPQAPPGYAPMMAAPAGVMSSTQTVSPPKTRIALGLTSFKISLPVPKLFAVQGEQEVVTRQSFQAPVQSYAPMAAVPMAAVPMQAPMQAMPVQASMQAVPMQAVPMQAPMQAVQAPPPVYAAPAAPPVYAAPPMVQYAPQPPQTFIQPTTVQGVVCVPTPGQPAPQPGCATGGCPPTHR